MRRFGVDAWIINRAANRQGFERSYPGLDIPVIYGEGDLSGKAQSLLVAHGVSVDAIVATSPRLSIGCPTPHARRSWGITFKTWRNGSSRTIRRYSSAPSGPTLGGRGRPRHEERWNRNEIVALGGQEPMVIGASVDVDLFHPRSDDGLNAKRPLHVVAMVRPESPWRGPDRTLRVLRRLKDTFNDAVVITCFGGSASDIAALRVPLDDIRVTEQTPS